MSNAGLQLVSVLLILAILLGDALPPLLRPARQLLWLLGLAALLMVVQLLPLPPAFWGRLPERTAILRPLRLAGIEPGWQPATLTPNATVAALLALLPAVAMAFAILASAESGRRLAIRILVGIALLSILLGACQRASGADSALYPYEVTNRGYAVGFFANRNHLGTLLLCALPFLAPALGRSDRHRPGGKIWIVAPLALLLAGGALLTGSVAAMALLPLVLVAAWLNMRPLPHRTVPLLRSGIMQASIAVLALLAVAGTWHLVHRSDDPQHRGVITPRTLHAAYDYAPFGSGGGSFQRVYPSYEDREAASPEYINHAHDDYAEVALEYGVPGLLLLGAAFTLWAKAARTAWSTDDPGARCARAASIATGAVLLHSFVDYPARTGAIEAVTAMAAAFMVSPVALVATPPKRPARQMTAPSLAVMIDEL